MDEEITLFLGRIKTVILVEGSHISADYSFREATLKL